jgi:hypothetical protein
MVQGKISGPEPTALERTGSGSGCGKTDADPHHGLLNREKEVLVINDVPDHWPEQPPPPAPTRVDSRTFQYMHFIRFVMVPVPYFPDNFSSKDIDKGNWSWSCLKYISRNGIHKKNT